MTIHQLLAHYQRWRGLRVAAHGLLWIALWVTTEDPDTYTPPLARLVELVYALASFYLLFYGPVPRWWTQRRYAGPLAAGLLLVMSSGPVMYSEYLLANPHSAYEFLPDYRAYGPLVIFLSGRYFFYAFFNGMILNLAGPAVLKLAKTLYERQLAYQQTEQLTHRQQLDVLLEQVSPHFLFNTLNNLYSLVLHADSRAPAITKQLAALLRYTDELAGQSWVTLAAEAEFTEDFLALVRLRYGADVRLESHWQLGQAGTKYIPPLLLLPLVENAVKHGLSQSLGAAWLIVRAEVRFDKVIITVANSRAEQSSTLTESGGGLGLNTLRKRLALLYPKDSPLQLEVNATTFQATLCLPLRSAVPMPPLPAALPIAVAELV